MEPIVYCWHCDEKHVASETLDTAGNAVGIFCNRKKALIVAHTSRWDGVDIYPRIEAFLKRNIDRGALARVKSVRLPGLSRKMAYLFTQTTYAQERRINYYWTQYHALSIIRKMKDPAFRAYSRGV